MTPTTPPPVDPTPEPTEKEREDYRKIIRGMAEWYEADDPGSPRLRTIQDACDPFCY